MDSAVLNSWRRPAASRPGSRRRTSGPATGSSSPASVEGQQHDPGQAERGLRGAPAAEHPWVQVDRAPPGQHVTHVLRRAAAGLVRWAETSTTAPPDRPTASRSPVLELLRGLAGAGDQPLVGSQPDRPCRVGRRPRCRGVVGRATPSVPADAAAAGLPGNRTSTIATNGSAVICTAAGRPSSWSDHAASGACGSAFQPSRRAPSGSTSTGSGDLDGDERRRRPARARSRRPGCGRP